MPSATLQMQSISSIITQMHTTTGDVPPPLVGATVTSVENQVLVFGGRQIASHRMTNHLYVLDLNTLCWTRHIPPPHSEKPPQPRYFHTAEVYKRSIIIFGGMGHCQHSPGGLCVLSDVAVFDVATMTWRSPPISPCLFDPRPRYGHVSAIAKDKMVIIGGQDMDNRDLHEINVLDLDTWEWTYASSFDKPACVYRSIAVSCQLTANDTLPTMAKPRTSAPLGDPCSSDMYPIYLYSNSDFSNVKRDLQRISLQTTTPAIQECSAHMTGSIMPPGLRFPTGHVLGHHLILAGTYLSRQSQVFSIWALNVDTLTWSRMETGAVFQSGSWNRGVLHAAKNRYMVFGHQDRCLLEDYNDRRVNFEHIVMIDLEAFGVYKPPAATCSSLAQEMGLGLLNEFTVSDFTLLTSDRQSIAVNSTILALKWPYFKSLLEKSQETSSANVSWSSSCQTAGQGAVGTQSRARCILFPYEYTVVIALVQFLYTDHLLTAQQCQLHTLSQLLLLADMYDLPRLCQLATHALHQLLNMSTAPLIFETAALAQKTSLQVRALKLMIAAKKMIQQQPLPGDPLPKDMAPLSSSPSQHGHHGEQALSRSPSRHTSKQSYHLPYNDKSFHTDSGSQTHSLMSTSPPFTPHFGLSSFNASKSTITVTSSTSLTNRTPELRPNKREPSLQGESIKTINNKDKRMSRYLKVKH